MFSTLRKSPGLLARGSKPITGFIRGTATLPRLSEAAAAVAPADESQPAAPKPVKDYWESHAQYIIAPDLIPRGEEFWRKVPCWQDVSANMFLSYKWGVSYHPHPLS